MNDQVMSEDEKLERFENLLSGDRNDPETQYQLALCYLNGEGVEANSKRAVMWLERAEKSGHTGAIKLLKSMRPQEAQEIDEENLPDFCVKAESGDLDTQFRVARYFLIHRTPGAEGDIERYLTNASGGGHPEACVTLARLRLGEHRDEEAISLLQSAVASGHPDAYEELGLCYANGRGVSPDQAEAERLLAQSATLGGGEHMLSLAIRYANGDLVGRSVAKALSWLKQAEDQGVENARQRYNAAIQQTQIRRDQLAVEQDRELAQRKADFAAVHQRELDQQRAAELAAAQQRELDQQRAAELAAAQQRELEQQRIAQQAAEAAVAAAAQEARRQDEERKAAEKERRRQENERRRQENERKRAEKARQGQGAQQLPPTQMLDPKAAEQQKQEEEWRKKNEQYRREEAQRRSQAEQQNSGAKKSNKNTMIALIVGACVVILVLILALPKLVGEPDSGSGSSSGSSMSGAASTSQNDVSSQSDAGSSSVNSSGSETASNLTSVDPFQSLQITVTGYSPFGRVIVENVSQDPFLSTLTFTASPTENIKNGDTLTVNVDQSAQEAADNGYEFSLTSRTYNVTGMEAYAASYEEIDATSSDAMQKKAEELVNAQFDTLTGDQLISDLGITSDTPGSVTMEHGTATLAGSYLMNLKNSSTEEAGNIYALVYSVPLTLVQAGNEVYNDNGYFMVSFKNLIVPASGGTSVDVDKAVLEKGRKSTDEVFQSYIDPLKELYTVNARDTEGNTTSGTTNDSTPEAET